ncbi:hypothetical protein SAMN05444159_1281 [Bradyrhizobium lablabi]|uniref:Phage terminase small subunit n=1 Tax=Bradyrhizobium lablabi TaxID=722472 RepID=A0A1M6LHV1_9BRAD|nr:hypothetical protein [Bradyrhizobium lablabi]SHJ70786.1 hypothetical protein SAMN05444159_1281 [Bradyrhizobium lablabi]
MKKKKKKVIDWKGIEKDYRAGKTSIRQIAEWYGVSEGAIRKRAKANNWSRMIRADAADTGTFKKLDFVPAIRKPEDAKTITREGKNLAVRMLSELMATTTQVDELEDMIISECAGDRDARRRTGMLRAVDLPARANTLKTLGLAVKAFIDADRADNKSPDPEQPDATAGTAAGKSGDDWDHLLQ